MQYRHATDTQITFSLRFHARECVVSARTNLYLKQKTFVFAVEMYLQFACCAAVPGGGRNKEYALHLLHMCKGNIHVRFFQFNSFIPFPPSLKFLYHLFSLFFFSWYNFEQCIIVVEDKKVNKIVYNQCLNIHVLHTFRNFIHWGCLYKIHEISRIIKKWYLSLELDLCYSVSAIFYVHTKSLSLSIFHTLYFPSFSSFSSITYSSKLYQIERLIVRFLLWFETFQLTHNQYRIDLYLPVLKQRNIIIFNTSLYFHISLSFILLHAQKSAHSLTLLTRNYFILFELFNFYLIIFINLSQLRNTLIMKLFQIQKARISHLLDVSLLLNSFINSINVVRCSFLGSNVKADETDASVASGTSVAELRVPRDRPMDVAGNGRILPGPVEVQQGLLCDLARRGWQVRETMRAILLSVEEAVPGRIQETACSSR